MNGAQVWLNNCSVSQTRSCSAVFRFFFFFFPSFSLSAPTRSESHFQAKEVPTMTFHSTRANIPMRRQSRRGIFLSTFLRQIPLSAAFQRNVHTSCAHVWICGNFSHVIQSRRLVKLNAVMLDKSNKWLYKLANADYESFRNFECPGRRERILN